MEFSPLADASFFDGIPAAPAVFLLRGDNAQSEPYVSKSANLRRRLQRLLGEPTERSKRLNLRDRIRRVEFTSTGSDFESGFLLYQLLRETFPQVYGGRMRFRFAPLIKLHMDNEYPRASITTRLGRLQGKSVYYGPFPSRALAEKFSSDSLDFFKMRRCVDDLHPDPSFPGCVYSEMKMCLAPCFKGCSDEEYQAETARVQGYFDSGGESLVREISAQRDSASSNLEFEQASNFHARLEKLKPLLSQLPELVRRIDQLKAVILQASAAEGAVNFFRVDAGAITGPVEFRIQPEEHTRPESMESRVENKLNAFASGPPKSSLEVMEHLAILRRWYFRSSRKGEIFMADANGVLPLRRIVRGISRVYRNEPAQAEDSHATGEAPVTPD
jgi:excinuclease UvrABC nuclease subunit